MKKTIGLILILSLLVVGLTSTVIAREITIKDYDGVSSTVDAPVDTIVSLNASLNQLLMALDSFDKVVAIDQNSKEDLYPQPRKALKVVGDNSHHPKVEAIAELDPDVVLASTMLTDDHREKISSFGIPVVVERMSDSERLEKTIDNIGALVGKEERANQLFDFISKYRNIIEERVAGLDEGDRTKVYWEWYKPYKTGSSGASVHPQIVAGGGENICANAKGRYPTVSSEYVWERNPEVIIKQAGRGDSVESMKKARNKLMNRDSLESTDAVENESVYVITWNVTSGLPSVVGELYFAKWIQPELFKDIDPTEVYAELLEKFLDVSNYTPRAYPY